MKTITKAQRDALLSYQIPFVALPDQIYLPFLGILLSNKFKKVKEIKKEKMMPATQQLFLFLFYRKGSSVLKSEAADALRLTRTSITRASEQLLAMDLIEQNKKYFAETFTEDEYLSLNYKACENLKKEFLK